MLADPILMTPGPTQVEAEVLLEAARPVVNHVSDQFDSLHRETLEMLNKVFNSAASILIPGSGTAAMELALRSVVKPGSRYLVLKTGYFGSYLEEGVRLLGGEPVTVEAGLGEGFDGSSVSRLLDEHAVDAVLLQHVDTSTGVANKLEEIARAARDRGVVVVVDAVASAGGMRIDVDGWGIDVVFTGSQKALSTPPGLGIVAYSSSYVEELSRRARSSLYFNIPRLLREMESTKNYYITPAVNMVRALNRSLKIILEEGDYRYRRHEVLARAVQRGVEAMGLNIVAGREWRSNTVTTIYLPEGVEWRSLYMEARRLGVELAGGLGSLKGRVFRIGHMGQASSGDIIATLAVVERALYRLGYSIELGTGLREVQKVLAGEDL
ncbi:MAG: alanine--glyoxylate aminotransferase family protein [Desulfurococcales archaeon]|nr:alanine--glyoxylate aminotransferase family protein [Desulfurococcales archaeon]